MTFAPRDDDETMLECISKAAVNAVNFLLKIPKIQELPGPLRVGHRRQSGGLRGDAGTVELRDRMGRRADRTPKALLQCERSSCLAYCKGGILYPRIWAIILIPITVF